MEEKQGNQEARKMAEKGAKVRKPMKKSVKITLIVLVAVLAVAGITVGILFWTGVLGGAEEAPEIKEEVTPIAIESPEVQHLYGAFGFKEQASELGQVQNFYADKGVREGQPSLTMMLDVVMTARKVALGECKLKYNVYDYGENANAPLMARYNQYKVAWLQGKWVGGKWQDEGFTEGEVRRMNEDGCYDGATAKQAIKEVFGQEVTLTDSTEVLGEWLHYAEKEDELFHFIWGKGDFAPSYVRVLTEAAKGEDAIYLYEVVGTMNQEGELTRLFGENVKKHKIDEGVSSEEYVKEHPDEFEHFRWTFRKTEVGNYVFEGLAEVK